MESTETAVDNNPAVDQVYQFDKCEVTLWKDGLVTITGEPQSPVISFRCAPNPWCGRD